MAEQQVLSTIFTAEIGDVLSKISDMIKGVLNLANTSTTLATAMGVSDSAIKSFTNSLKSAEAFVEKFDKALKDAGQNTQSLGKAVNDALVSINGIGSQMESGGKRTQVYKDALAKLKAEYGDQAPVIRGLVKELNTLDNEHHKMMLNDPSKSFKSTYEASILAGDAIDRYRQSVATFTPSLVDLKDAHAKLGTSLTEAEFRTTSLGKAFLTSSSQSKEFKAALLEGGAAYGENTVKINSFIKSLGEVDKHLRTIPQSSALGKDALKALSDSSELVNLANLKMNGSIVAVKGGFEATKDTVKASGVVMNQYGQLILDVHSTLTNAKQVFTEYSQTHKNNSTAVSQGAERLREYAGIVEQVKAKVKDTSNAVIASGDGFRLYGNKVNDAAALSKQMSFDQGNLTRAFNTTDQIMKVLNGEQELSVSALSKVAVAANQNRAAIVELAADYTGLNKGLKEVGSYHQNYYDSLQKTTAGQLTNTTVVEQAVAAHTKYAKTAEGLIAQSHQLTEATVNQIKSSSSYAQNLQAGNVAIAEAKAGHDSLVTALRSTEAIQIGVTREGGNLRDSMLNVANSMGVSAQQTDMLRSEASKLIPMTEKYRTVIEQLNKDIASGSMSHAEATRILDQHKQSVAASEAAIKAQNKALQDAEKAAKAANGVFGEIVQTIKSFAVFTIASTVISAFIGSITNTVATVMNFDQTLHSLKAITGATSAEIAVMGDVIKSTSANSRYGTEEIGKGLEIMGQAGLSATESINTIKSATILATGTLEKMETTVDLLTSTMSAYQINTLESGRVADIMAIAVNNSKLSVDKLRTSLNYVGVIAAQSGLSLEQTNASLMLLADRGMKASTIGTGLRQVLDKLIAPNEKLREAYQSHGIALDEINPLTVGFEKSLENLTKTLFNTKTGMVDTQKAFELFGIRGAQAATILIQAFQSGEWQKTIESFNDVGVAARMAEEQMQGLSAMWDNFIAKLKVIAVSLGEGGLQTAIKTVIQFFTLLADGVLKFINIDWGIIGKATQYIMALATAVTISVSGFTAYNTVVALATNNSSFLNKAIVALGTAFANFFTVIGSSLLGKFALIIGTISVAFSVYQSQLKGAIEEHQKLATEAQKNSEILTLFTKAISESTEGTKQYTTNIGRLKSEYPELAKQIADFAGVNDIATLSQDALIASMNKLKASNIEESIKQNTEAISDLAKQEAIAELNTSIWNATIGLAIRALGDFWGAIKEAYAAVAEFFAGWGINIDYMARVSDKMKKGVNELAKSYVEFGKSVSDNLDDAEKASLSRLETEAKTNSQIKAIYEDVVKEVKASFAKQREAQKQMQVRYEEYTNEVSKFYGSLSSKQKMEIQSVVAEEEKAVEQYRKFAGDKKLAAEEIESSVYAIRLKFLMKALGAMNDAQKKEYESEEDKFRREQTLLDSKLENVRSKLEEEELLHTRLLAKKGELTKQEQSEIKIHLINIQTLNKQHEEIILGQKLLAFEEVKKLMSQVSELLKSNQNYELSLIDAYESSKLSLKVKTTQEELKLKEQEIEMIQKVMAKEIEKNGISSGVLEKYNELLQQKSKERLDITTRLINEENALAKYWFDEQSKYQDKLIEAVKNSATFQLDNIKMSYELQEQYAQTALDKRLEKIDIEEKNLLKVEEKKFKAKQEYWEKEKTALDKNLQDNKSVLDKEYEQNVKLINDKYNLEIDYNNKLSSGATKTSGDIQKIEKDKFNALQKAQTEYIDKKIKNEEDYFNKLKKLISDEENAVIASMKNIDKIQKDMIKLKDDYTENIRKNRQKLMTEEQQYYDDLKAINELTNKAMLTQDQTYVKDQLSLINSLPTEVKKADGTVVVSKTQMVGMIDKLLTDNYELAVKLSKNQIEKEKENIKTLEESIAKHKQALEEARAELQKFQGMKIEIETTQFLTAIETILKNINAVETALNSMKENTSVDTNTQALEAKINGAQQIIDGLIGKINDTGNKANLNVTVSGGADKVPLPDYLNLMKASVEKHKEDIEKIKPKVEVEFKATGVGDKTNFNEAIGEIGTQVKGLAEGENALTKYNPSFTVLCQMSGITDAVQTFKDGYTLLMQKINDLPKDTSSKHTIEVEGLDLLQAAIDKHRELVNIGTTHSYHVIHVSTVEDGETEEAGNQRTGGYIAARVGGFIEHLRSGGAFAGKIPGYGGGDIVNAMLEPGEFVMRKEAVKNIGVNALRQWNNLNSSAQKSLNPQSGASSSNQLFTGQLHTIDLNIGNESNRIYAEPNVLNNLTSSLRRARLMKA